jgi:integrase
VVAYDEKAQAWRSVVEIGWDHKEFALYVWRSVRKKGETKTQVSKMTAHNIRRDFRKVLDSAKLTGKDWAPRELRHSFVSLLSDRDIPIEDISRLVRHSNTARLILG